MVQGLKNSEINAKMCVFIICVRAIIYFLLYNFLDCTFKKMPKSKCLLLDTGPTLSTIFSHALNELLSPEKNFH